MALLKFPPLSSQNQHWLVCSTLRLKDITLVAWKPLGLETLLLSLRYCQKKPNPALAVVPASFFPKWTLIGPVKLRSPGSGWDGTYLRLLPLSLFCLICISEQSAMNEGYAWADGNSSSLSPLLSFTLQLERITLVARKPQGLKKACIHSDIKTLLLSLWYCQKRQM